MDVMSQGRNAWNFKLANGRAPLQAPVMQCYNHLKNGSPTCKQSIYLWTITSRFRGLIPWEAAGARHRLGYPLFQQSAVTFSNQCNPGTQDTVKDNLQVIQLKFKYSVNNNIVYYLCVKSRPTCEAVHLMFSQLTVDQAGPDIYILTDPPTMPCVVLQ